MEHRHDLEHHVVGRMVRMADVPAGELQIDLNEVDRERAARFRLDDDRTRFIVGRALLKKLLGRTLGMAELAYTAEGRPFLPNYPALHFSITHSGDLVAVAIATGAQVGIDVEYMPRALDFDALAERIFSAADLKKFRALPPDAVRAAFFRAWTGKEAVLKARGVGLFGGLKEVSIPREGTGTAVSTLDPRDDDAARNWCVQSISLPADYMGHVAWDDPRKELDFREIKLEDLS